MEPMETMSNIYCDYHGNDMPSPSPHFGPNLEAIFVPDLPGKWEMIIQMKYNAGAYGTMLLGTFQFDVEKPGSGTTESLSSSTTGMTDSTTGHMHTASTTESSSSEGSTTDQGHSSHEGSTESHLQHELEHSSSNVRMWSLFTISAALCVFIL